MDEIHINHLAVITCAVLNLALGAIWYSPLLFYKAWMQENKFTEEDLIISYNMAFFLGNAETDYIWGATAGFLAGFGFSALIFTIVALFEQRSWKYILINGGYITIYFTLVGFILGIWR